MAEEQDGNIPAVEDDHKPEEIKEQADPTDSQELSKPANLPDLKESSEIEASGVLPQKSLENSLEPNQEIIDEENKDHQEEEEEKKVESEHKSNEETAEDALPEKNFVPTNPCIEWVKSKIELDDYNPEL